MTMRKIIYTFAVLAMLLTVACDDYETYGELKEKERNNIRQFIADSSFVIIDETQFHEQGDITIGDKQFVYLSKSGVYMQILREGCGMKIKDGESLSVICRFTELGIQDGSILTNNDPESVYDPDIMNVTKAGSTYTASYISGMMYLTYGSGVPEGWLVPYNYIKIGRLMNPDDELARVRLIVPHSQGTTSNAKSNVKPYFYDIIYQRGR